MTIGRVAGFFLDSCVLLPQSLDATYDACSSFLNTENRFFVSQSIRDEALELSKECYSVICISLRHYLKPALERSGIKEITNRDGKIVANVFSEQKKRIIKEFPTKSNVRGELVGVIENHIAKKIHNLKDGVTLPIDTLLASALTELEEARYEIEKPFKRVETIFITPDNELASLSSLKDLVSNQKDAYHLASAITYQFKSNQWVIFVTNDEKDILTNEKDIWDNFALQCTKPSWALDYYKDIIKLEPPVEFYRNKLIPTPKQKEFGTLIEKILNIRILRKPFIY